MDPHTPIYRGDGELMRKAASRTRVGRYVSALPRKEPPRVPLHLDTALNEHSVCRERRGQSRLCRQFPMMGGVYFNLDILKSIRFLKAADR